MILMSVGDDKTFDLVDVALQISNIRDDQVDTQHIIRRKCKTAVYHYNGVLILKCGNVHTDLLQTA